MTHKRRTAWDDLASAFIVFAVFAWEFVVLLLDPVWNPGERDHEVEMWHRLGTAAGWIFGAILLGRNAARVGVFSDRRKRINPLPSSVLGYVTVLGAVVLAVAVRTVAFGEMKIVGEFTGLGDRAGSGAPLSALALVAYYVAETALIVLLLLFAQRAGETRFGHPAIPWGGLVLALTWGVMHFFLQGPSAGLYAVFAAILYGVIIVYGPRSLLAVSAIVALAFVL